jgi:hypothetical protein
MALTVWACSPVKEATKTSASLAQNSKDTTEYEVVIIESYIDYRPNIDYGIEVNRKLFWYFKYVKSKYGINLF